MSQTSANSGTPKRVSDRFRIVAPVNRLDEVQALSEAGADEIYCGVLTSSWAEKYGDWDCLSRRQGNIANLTSVKQLQEVAKLSKDLGIQASLALNVGYTEQQISDVLDLADTWEEAGGAAVVVSSLAVLIGLQQRRSGLLRHISILANVTNSKSVAFFHHFDAKRIILPRELTISEMAAVASSHPGIEYEAMALNEKCRFIDGLCGFYHGTMFPDDAASVFTFEKTGQDGTPVVYSQDLCYAGHGCQVPFADEFGQLIEQPNRDDVNHPSCAACALPGLSKAGVNYLKIGGRGLPPELKLRAVSFLRKAAELAYCDAGMPEFRRLYRAVFGRDCFGSSCYYPSDLRAEA